MNLQSLPKVVEGKKRRLGQGHGSGRSKTAGRGTKGQKARNSVPIYFEGGALPLIKRLPFRRGKGKNKVFRKKPVVINLKILNLFPKDSVVDVKALVKKGIVNESDAKTYGVKILGDGEIGVPLTVSIDISKHAAEKIQKAGGKIQPI